MQTVAQHWINPAFPAQRCLCVGVHGCVSAWVQLKVCCSLSIMLKQTAACVRPLTLQPCLCAWSSNWVQQFSSTPHPPTTLPPCLQRSLIMWVTISEIITTIHLFFFTLPAPIYIFGCHAWLVCLITENCLAAQLLRSFFLFVCLISVFYDDLSKRSVAYLINSRQRLNGFFCQSKAISLHHNAEQDRKKDVWNLALH